MASHPVSGAALFSIPSVRRGAAAAPTYLRSPSYASPSRESPEKGGRSVEISNGSAQITRAGRRHGFEGRQFTFRRDGRAVEGGGLENCRPARVRGFESLPLRQRPTGTFGAPCAREGGPASWRGRRRGDRVAEGARLLSECAGNCTEGSNPSLSATPFTGEMAERLKAHAWKACVGQPTVGSNPTLSAN